jgi:hypothetical protein
MRRENRFVLSRNQYAVDLNSLRSAYPEAMDEHAWARESWIVDVVSFRRVKGVLRACAGTIGDRQDETPLTGAEFLSRIDENNHVSVTPMARWDGTSYWGFSQDPKENVRHLELLRLMLAGFPSTPAPFDGWWVF